MGLARIAGTAFPTWGPAFQTVMMAIIVINMLTGPPAFRAALIQVCSCWAPGCARTQWQPVRCMQHVHALRCALLSQVGEARAYALPGVGSTHRDANGAEGSAGAASSGHVPAQVQLTHADARAGGGGGGGGGGFKAGGGEEDYSRHMVMSSGALLSMNSLLQPGLPHSSSD